MRAYRIGTASRLSGVEVATLRNWEKRYGMVVPRRNGGGQRLYSQLQIQQLRLLRRWTDAGLSASEAHARLWEHLAHLTRARGDRAIPDPEQALLRASRLDSDVDRGLTRTATIIHAAQASRTRAAALRHQSVAARDRATSGWGRVGLRRER
jgi:DNA-binding transcriptional MerR regulator